MHSPATGRITADLILKGSSEIVDASQLSIERFAKGQLLEETAVLWRPLRRVDSVFVDLFEAWSRLTRMLSIQHIVRI